MDQRRTSTRIAANKDDDAKKKAELKQQTKTKPSKTKPTPPAFTFTNYLTATLQSINSLEQKYAIKKSAGRETIEMKLKLPSSIIIKQHIMMNMPDGMSYEDDKFQDALSYLLKHDIIVVNDDCVYSTVDSKSKLPANTRFDLCALPFVGKNDLLPAGINYSSVPIELLRRVHPNATVPDNPIVADDGLAETPGDKRLLSWHMAQIVEKVMTIKEWDDEKVMKEIGMTTKNQRQVFRRFLRMKKYHQTGVATNAGGIECTDPTTIFQDSTWYKTLVSKMVEWINGMDDKDKKDCLSLWTDGEIQLSNFQLHPSLDVSQFLSHAAFIDRIKDHSENEEAVYFDLYNMHARGMFHLLPPTIYNGIFLQLMTGRKSSDLVTFMNKERKKDNKERADNVPPLPALPKIRVSTAKYVELPNPDQARLLELGKTLDLIAKEVVIKKFKTEEKKRGEASAEHTANRKEAFEQNKKDREDKLDKALPHVLSALNITHVLSGNVPAAECAQAMITLVGLFNLGDIHKSLEEIHLGEFLGRIFGKDKSKREKFFDTAMKNAGTASVRIESTKPYMHEASGISSADIQGITGEMKSRFSKDYSVLQSKEEGDSDEDKKPAAKKRAVVAISSPADDEVYASEPAKPKPKKLAKTFYTDVARKDVKAANPTASAKEINKILSDNYKALSAEERAPYEAKFAVEKKRYEKEMASLKAASKDSAVASVKMTKTSTKKPGARKVAAVVDGGAVGDAEVARKKKKKKKKARALPTKANRDLSQMAGFEAAALPPAPPMVRIRDNEMAPEAEGAMVPMVSHSYSADSSAVGGGDVSRNDGDTGKTPESPQKTQV